MKSPSDKRYRKRHRKGNKLRRRQQFREFMALVKSDPCADCKRTWPSPVMEFDHVRGHKCCDINRTIDKPLSVVCDEIVKCDLVCANCHRLRHIARRL